jgi:copper transport protein
VDGPNGAAAQLIRLSRQICQPVHGRDPLTEALALACTMLPETVVLIGVLAVTGWLVNVSPTLDVSASSGQVSSTAGAIEQTVPVGSDTITARITLGTVGINSLEFTITDQTGQATGVRPDGSVTHASRRRRPAHQHRAGAYQAVLDLPLSGQWVVSIAVRTSEFDQPTANIPVNLP